MTEINKKKHPLIFVFIALLLILALIFTGFSYPGFMLPAVYSIANPQFKASTEGKRFTYGHSKAFSKELVKGVTVSAEKDALDKDRKFKMTEMDSSEYESYGEIFNHDSDEPGMLLGVWELDAGLKDDEMLPGNFNIDVDLDEMGVDEADYDNVCLYRIDDAGMWHELSGTVNGHTFSSQSNQNCPLALILVGIGTVLIGGTAIYQDEAKFSNAGAYTVKMKGVDHFELKVDNKKFKILLKSEEFKKMIFEETENFKKLDVQLHNKAVKRTFIECLEKSDFPEDVKSKIKGSLPEVLNYSTLFSQMRNEILAEYIKKYPAQVSALMKSVVKDRDKYYKEELYVTDEYKKFDKELEELKKDRGTQEGIRKHLKQVDKVCEYLSKAHFFLKDQVKVSIPTYTMEVHITDSRTADAEGEVLVSHLYRPYMVLNPYETAEGTDSKYDELLLTICHEMFHAVQRYYVSAYRCNAGFDEMSAQLLEYDAFKYFSSLTKDGITSPESEHLKNMKHPWYFAIPLDAEYTKYPEGTIGRKGEVPQANYARAPFMKYLRGGELEDAGYYTYDDMLKKYKSVWRKGSTVNILETVYSMDDKTLTRSWYNFAREEEDMFYNAARAEGDKSVFAPKLTVGEKCGKVSLPNKSYTIRVRRIYADPNLDRRDEYAVLIMGNEEYKGVLSDLKLLPLKMEEYEDYRSFDKGIFIDPRPLNADVNSPVMYLLEADGGTGKNTEGMIYDDANSGYGVYVITAPEPETVFKDGELTIEPIELKGDEKEVIDSIAVTVILDDKEIHREQIMLKDWKKEKTIDLSKITIAGKAISEDELNRLIIRIQKCVKDTFKDDEPLLGPAYEDVKIDTGIAGTWEIETVTDYSSQLLDGYVDQLGASIQANANAEDALIDPKALQGYVDQYKDSQKDQKAKGYMYIRKAQDKNKYDAIIRYENGAPDSVFNGTYNEKKKELVLKPVDAGKAALDLKNASIRINITAKKNNNKEQLYCKGKIDFDSPIVSYKMELKGKKIADDTNVR